MLPACPEASSGHDVRVGQASSDADLTEESIGAQHRGDLRTQDLDGNLSIVFALEGEIHRRHATLTQLPLDLVHRCEGFAHLVEVACPSTPTA